MDQIVVDLHRQLVKTMNAETSKAFNRIFSEMFSLQPPADLLRGLNAHKKLVVIRDAIIETDLQMKTTSSSHIPLFTPALSVLFTSMIATTKLKPECKQHTAPKPAKVSNPPQSAKSQKATTGPKVACAEPGNSKTDNKAEAQSSGKRKRFRKPSPEKLSAIYDELFQKMASSQLLYGKFSYMSCDKINCVFCRTMFLNMQLTKCSHFGHARCTKQGWYPHVGPALWKILSKCHNNTAFRAQDRELKPTELASLNSHSKNENSVSYTPKHTPAEYDREMDDDSTSTITSMSSSSGVSSDSRKRSSKRVADDWSENMSELNLSPRRNKIE